MRTPREWRRLVDSLRAHAETAQHPTDIRRYKDATQQARALSTYVNTAPDELLDAAFDRLNAAGLIPTREDMDVVAVLTSQIHNTAKEAA